jgi:hypothetical protein
MKKQNKSREEIRIDKRRLALNNLLMKGRAFCPTCGHQLNK